jgi:hypothetical protein
MDIVEASRDIYLWLHKKLDGMDVAGDQRTRTAASCLNLSMEHQTAVTILVEHRLYGSALALARCVFESYVRGIWFKRCATDDQIADYLIDKFKFTFQALISDIEKLPGYSDGVLSKAKKNRWKLLNDLTHTGAQQVLRRSSDNFIEPNYDPTDILAIVDFVNSIALLAGLEAADLSQGDKDDLQKEFLVKVKEYKGSVCIPNKSNNCAPAALDAVTHAGF